MCVCEYMVWGDLFVKVKALISMTTVVIVEEI